MTAKPRKKSGTPLKLDPETAAAVSSLQHHPGFVYLIAKLDEAATSLDAKLHERQSDLREVDFLQSGIFWAGWLERQVESITKTLRVQPTPLAIDETIADFNRLSANLERLGTPN